MTDTRTRIEEHVRAHPGVHFSGLVRRLDLAPGQVQYHVKRLRQGGDLVAERFGGRTHYYPDGYDGWERRALALLRRETAGDIVAILLADGPRRPGPLAEELDVARSTLAWHVERLVEHDLVEKRRTDSDGVTLAAARPAETVRLLGLADPHLVDRLVDRFTVLVDRLLE